MMLFTVDFLKETFPLYKGIINEKLEIEHIMTDSRTKQNNALFVPIVGERFDGHDFINEAINQGAVAALWDEKVEIPTDVPASFLFFIMNDTLNGLQQLAKAYREMVNPVVIGVTGSNGKTTTKDLLKAVLQTKYRTYATVGNFNNHIGLPLTILQMKQNTEMLILEMGMNDFNEIDLLTKIAKPEFAIITNIGESHIEHLGSREGIAEAKLEIKNGLQKEGLLIIDGDESLLSHLRNEPYTVTCGFNQVNDIVVSEMELNTTGTKFTVNGKRYIIPLLGKHHAKNASFVIAVAKKLGIDEEEIKQGLEAVEQTQMRFELMKGKNGVSIINDAYNASPTSMKAAIEVLIQLTGFSKKIVVLGDILELGHYSDSLHRSVATAIDTNIDHVFTFGKSAKLISDEVSVQKRSIETKHFETKEALIKTLETYLSKDTIILFKASRGMAFEQYIKQIL